MFIKRYLRNNVNHADILSVGRHKGLVKSFDTQLYPFVFELTIYTSFKHQFNAVAV